MVRHVKINKSGSLRETLPGGREAGHPRSSASPKVVVPAMYMRPLGDREFQGCLKSRV